MIKKLLGDVKRWLFRYSVATLTPINEIINEIVNEAAIWQCQGNDPQFSLSLNHNTPLLGFYMLELSATEPLGNSQSCLYWSKQHEGFTEENSTPFKLGNRNTVKRIVYFKEFANNFRWDPAEEAIALPEVKLTLAKLSSRYSSSKMLKKLIATGLDEAELRALSAENLYLRYNQFFSQKRTEIINYHDWLLQHEQWCPLVENQTIKFSVIMPVYNPEVSYFTEAIESVLAQSYNNWELCIADDCSDSDEIRHIIANYSANDSRIKHVFRTENGHISAASNSALTLASGDYIVLLDHDDLLAANALNEVATSLHNNNAKVVYSDEDKMNAKGVRYDPHFKSAFNRELILSHNYISHLGVYDKALVMDVGGFRLGYEGSQDYDLLLRCLAKVRNDEVYHIAKVLYHWRAIEGSTALTAGEKDYTSIAGLKALKSAVNVIDPSWTVEHGQLPNTYKVLRPILKEKRVSIIIPTKDQQPILKVCIDSLIEKTQYANYDIIIVNNGSVEKSTLNYFKTLEKIRNVRVLDYDKPFNFSAINNYAVDQCSQSDFVLMLNNDVEIIEPYWLNEMMTLAEQDDVGCVGAKLYYSNGKIQHAGVILGIGGVAGHSHKYFNGNEYGYFSRLKLRQDLSAVTAACLLVRKSTYLAVGGLNEDDLTIAFNDVDFCLKVRSLGLRNVWTPFAELYHHESISRGAENTPEKVKRFNQEVNYMKNTWGDALLSDPYYNKNLTLTHENFTLKAHV